MTAKVDHDPFLDERAIAYAERTYRTQPFLPFGEPMDRNGRRNLGPWAALKMGWLAGYRAALSDLQRSRTK